MRHRLARALVKLAARIDQRPHVKYSISHSAPQDWSHLDRDRLSKRMAADFKTGPYGL